MNRNVRLSKGKRNGSIEGRDDVIAANRLIGPFNFILKRTSGAKSAKVHKRHNYVDSTLWNLLDDKLRQLQIQSDTKQIIPI